MKLWIFVIEKKPCIVAARNDLFDITMGQKCAFNILYYFVIILLTNNRKNFTKRPKRERKKLNEIIITFLTQILKFI